MENSCLHKVKFQTELQAVARLRQLIALKNFKPWEMHTYKCEFCDCFHIGHADRKTQSFVKDIIKNRKPPTPLIKLKK